MVLLSAGLRGALTCHEDVNSETKQRSSPTTSLFKISFFPPSKGVSQFHKEAKINAS